MKKAKEDYMMVSGDQCRVWWYIALTPGQSSLRQQDYCEFHANLGYLINSINIVIT